MESRTATESDAELEFLSFFDEEAELSAAPTLEEIENPVSEVVENPVEPEFELGFSGSGSASDSQSSYTGVDSELRAGVSEPAPEPEPKPLAGAERRRSERIRLNVPIRVIGFDDGRGRFIEDTHTIVISETGSLIAMQHKVFPADVVRIINLENLEEADFRVVGPSIVTESEVFEWGIESADKTRNIWGIKFPPPLPEDQAGALLECRACHRQEFWPATLLEVEILERTGMIALDCETCRKPTYWIYAEMDRRPSAFALADAVAPPPRVVPIREQAERRKNKRVLLKLPLRVVNRSGQTEILRTENMSKTGLAVSLQMEMEVGEIVNVMCPYVEGGTNIEQRCEVRWKDPYPAGKRRYYGLRFIRKETPRA